MADKTKDIQQVYWMDENGKITLVPNVFKQPDGNLWINKPLIDKPSIDENQEVFVKFNTLKFEPKD
jgi:hypothetical protein